MKNRLPRLIILVWCVLLVSGSLFAHHGTNVSYDRTKPTRLTGLVTEFIWKNPHAAVLFDVTDENGNVVRWGTEMNSPGVLVRAGWTRDTLKAGDEIELTVFPSRAGTSVGVLDRGQPMFANGKQVLGTGELD